MKTVIILPTYNEQDNIGPLIAALEHHFLTMPHEMHILVVDDNSPDGTADVVREIQKQHGNVHLLQGQKAGLGAAYIRGIHYALDALEADAVFEMDADFSHKPEDVPRLLAALDAGADLVIGSRYVKGGSIPGAWGMVRRLNSRVGNVMARYVAGMSHIRDCTAGFRVIRRWVLQRIPISDLKVKGYAFQVALLHAAVLQGAIIKEIPVDFTDRVHGESKLGLADIVEFIINAWWIRFQSSKILIKFSLVGISGVLVNLAVFTLLLTAGMSPYIASPIAIAGSILSNVHLNNAWTFRRLQTRDGVGLKGRTCNMVSILALGISYGTFVVLSTAFPEVKPQIHQFLGIVPATLVNYFMNAYGTFRPGDGTASERSLR